jgi:hypothetical protein
MYFANLLDGRDIPANEWLAAWVCGRNAARVFSYVNP